MTTEPCAPLKTICTVDWKNFVRNVTSELNISEVNTFENQSRNFKSYMSDRLMGTKSSVLHQSLPMDGFILNTLTVVHGDFQCKGTIRTSKV